jgi:RHS repeat-associated protein
MPFRVADSNSQVELWSPVYVDALILRDRDTNGDGTLDERLWVVQDANYNVTALLDNAGNVVERYIYDPFGQATGLDAEWNVRAGGSAYDWLYLHQGGRYDVTSGVYHFRFRDDSPTLGRWTSLDPLRYTAGDVNLYRTVGNNPLNSLDPSGLDEIVIEGNSIYFERRYYVTFWKNGGTYWIGTLIEHEGVQYVQHGQYWVPLAEVKGTIERTFTVGYGGEWRKDPNKITEWFRDYDVRGKVTQPRPPETPSSTPAFDPPPTPDFYLFGQPSYWPWSKVASLNLWENIKHIGRMVPVAGAGVVGGGLSGAGIGALCGGGGGVIPGALGGAASGLIAAAFAKDPAEAFAYGFAGGILGGGATAATTRFAAGRAAGQAAAGAVTQAGRAREAVADPNKLHHIFGEPKHNLGPLLNQFGGNQQAAFEAVQNAAQAAIQQQGITGKYKIVVNVAGLDVTVKGTVMNGVARIGTFYIPLR